MVGVLFVCMGNICRSPLGEGVFRHLALEAGLKEGRGHDFYCSSAGTAGYHVGNPPDQRSQSIARTAGIDISNQRSQKVTINDFNDFDYIVAMDINNTKDLRAICPEHHLHKITLLLDYSHNQNPKEVSDPYYGGDYGFKLCLDLIQEASEGLLTRVLADHFPNSKSTT
ncbi:MAG: low molecular weight protein-tyrosine-phosphatase [Sphingomonadales bacterium]|jgi:protein-tyrosine phosphatase